MACARWTKGTPACEVQSRVGFPGASARLFTLAAHHNRPNTAPTRQLNRISLPHSLRLRVVLMCVLCRFLCVLVRFLARGGGERELEIVVLRHQLAILRRGGKRPRYTTADRALLAAASRLLPQERWSCFAVSPPTLRRWHRALLQGGCRRRPRRPGRPPLGAETRSLIKRLARENPRWGYMRIEGELLKLGISLSADNGRDRVARLGPRAGAAPDRP